LSEEERIRVPRGAVSVPHSAERAVFTRLVEEHGAAVSGMLRRVCGNRPDADDALQETALRVWRNLHARPRLRNPRAWLMTIAYHVFADQYAHKRQTEILLEHADPRSARATEWIDDSDAHDQAQKQLDQLPEAIRSVVVLHYTGGLSLRETAAALDISVGTVKSRLNNALERLRRNLA
jgi:RNA polymerase sigma-70 factor (ECF subfamily)